MSENIALPPDPRVQFLRDMLTTRENPEGRMVPGWQIPIQGIAGAIMAQRMAARIDEITRNVGELLDEAGEAGRLPLETAQLETLSHLVFGQMQGRAMLLRTPAEEQGTTPPDITEIQQDAEYAGYASTYRRITAQLAEDSQQDQPGT